MKKKKYKAHSKVWKYPGFGGWHFVHVDKKQSKEIQEVFGELKRGWGSLPVVVTIGKTSWKTSIFPDKKAGVYILGIKAEVRKKENISIGDKVKFTIEIQGV